ncbi:hypothetical protein BJ964_007055 [Actinoplanes lobatus]|uniref:Tn3 transposase DDE domain-containing protein n=1 Tax=Actinoplanes lobatus TaxID=113568 RepID=A0A7W7HLU6_9ACTN|nr:hypothetical protein [Actinoplanes lobatus]
MQRAGEVTGLGLSGLDVGVVPLRRVWELARYGLEAKAPTLRRHPYPRKLATLLATVRALEARLTQLGEALAGYGRIFKTLHVLTFVDDEPYRRQIKGIRNLNEGRASMLTIDVRRW